MSALKNLSPCDRNKVIHLSEVIIKKIERDNLSPVDFVDVPASYLREIFGGNYHKWLKIIIDSGLLQVQTWVTDKGELVQYEPGTTHMYEPVTCKKYGGNGQCKRYGFSPGLLTTNVVPVEFKKKVEVRKEEKTIMLGGEEWDKVILLQELTCFNFYTERLLAMVGEVAESKAEEVKIINAEYSTKFLMKVKVISTNTTINKISLKEALWRAEQGNCDLLKDGTKIIICKLENYKKIKPKIAPLIISGKLKN